MTATLALSLAACSGSFKSTEQLSSNPNNQNNGQGATPPIDNTQTWDKVTQEVNSKADGGFYDGRTMIRIDKTRQSIILTLPLPDMFFLSLSAVSLSQMPGASVEEVDNADGSKSWAFVIPLHYIIKGAAFSNFNTLPNGDTLPYLPAGEISGFAIQFPEKPNYRIYLYIAVNAAAVFIETPDWEIPPEFSFLPGVPVKNEAKTRTIGYFKLIPNKSTYASGVYLAARLPSDLARTINDLIQY